VTFEARSSSATQFQPVAWRNASDDVQQLLSRLLVARGNLHNHPTGIPLRPVGNLGVNVAVVFRQLHEAHVAAHPDDPILPRHHRIIVAVEASQNVSIENFRDRERTLPRHMDDFGFQPRLYRPAACPV
jgi:hypothetical protein